VGKGCCSRCRFKVGWERVGKGSLLGVVSHNGRADKGGKGLAWRVGISLLHAAFYEPCWGCFAGRLAQGLAEKPVKKGGQGFSS
jgi:hypothetical protein